MYFQSYLATLLPPGSGLSHSKLLLLLDLPNETLYHIIGHLRDPDAERLARTFNSVLTALWLPFLKDRVARARHERSMVNVFGYMCGLA
jgi:hypothetical protein